MGVVKNFLTSSGRFFQTMVRSCYDMELYRAVRTGPWQRALGYFVVFNVFIVLLTLVDLAPSTWVAVKHGRQYIADKVPDKASITIRSGKLETNLPSPTDLGDAEMPVIVDASVSGMSAQPDIGADAGFVIGRDVLVVQQSANDRRIMALSELPDFSVSKESVLDWIDRYGGWLVVIAILIFVPAYFLASLAGAVVFVLLTAVIALVFSLMWKLRLRYRQWVAVGFHAVTLPTLANFLFDEFGMTVPWVFTFLFFMIIIAVIADERAAPTDGQATTTDAPIAPPAPVGPPPEPEPKPRRRRAPARKTSSARRKKRSEAAPPAEPPAETPPAS